MIFLLGFRYFLVVGFSLLGFISFTASRLVELNGLKEGFIYKHDRSEDVKSACKSVLLKARPLVLSGRDFSSTVSNHLSFSNGDWVQENHGSPIMPYLDKNTNRSFSGSTVPLSLVSLFIGGVNGSHPFRDHVSLTGSLRLRTAAESLYPRRRPRGTPRFTMWPRHSELTVDLQGVYTESSEENGNSERVICMLGETMLPPRHSKSSEDPWDWMKNTGSHVDPPLLQDDQILLLLHYPKKYTLTNRAIHGELISLHSRSNEKYFDKLKITSQPMLEEIYTFGSEETVRRSCDPYTDPLLERGIYPYRGNDFCTVFQRITGYGQSLTVRPNYRCNGTGDFCSNLGPFGDPNGGGFKDVNILIQNLVCKQENSEDGATSTARIAAVFRSVRPRENLYSASQRSGMGNNNTVSAEGIWRSSNGRVCMIGCSGSSCATRISLYIPLSFSIRQRAIILGTFSSVSSDPHFSFDLRRYVDPSELYDELTHSNPFYTYSKIDRAGAVLEKHEPFRFGTIVKRSILKYPKLEPSKDYLESLSLLSEDLTLHSLRRRRRRPSNDEVRMSVLSLGPLFGRYWSSGNASVLGNRADEYTTEKNLLLNVSATLILSPAMNFSELFMEGVYDPKLGKMYTIGCRDVRAPWSVLYETADLESGLDCLIEAVVSYPPITADWLVDPTASISVSSQRNDDDPLHFGGFSLRTSPVTYRSQREGMLSRRMIETVLEVLSLSVSSACVLSQLTYVRTNPDVSPYSSLIMLAIEAVGYGLPLVTDAEAVVIRKNRHPDDVFLAGLNASFLTKLLTLFSLVITLRMFHKCWKSRTRMGADRPTEKPVFAVVLIVHVALFVSILAARGGLTPSVYVGITRDLFLLPQAIGNVVWRANFVLPPLRKLYFVGITGVRLLPRFYDCLRRRPYADGVYAERRHGFVDFHYSVFWDLVIQFVVVSLAVLVFVQQKCRRSFVYPGFLQPMRSRVYEKLPPESCETELSSATVVEIPGEES